MSEPKHNQRAIDVKVRVEELKTLVRTLQDQLPQAKADANLGKRGGWPEYSSLKRRWTTAVNDLGKAKADLVKLSGTTGGDPRWELCQRAWRVLNRLDEAGIDIGDDGHQLLDDIEFHVPASKLDPAGVAGLEAP